MPAASIATMRQAGADVLGALDSAQHDALLWRFADETDRRKWAYFPRAAYGLQIGALDDAAQKLVHRLLVSGLSYHAYAKVVAVMAQERLVDLDEARRLSAIRDPGRYFLRFFGEPRDDAWGWQYEGHHVSLNVTVAGDEAVSATPIFIGSQPAHVEHAGYDVMRICGEEEDAGRELLLSLDGEQQSRAVICDVAPPDFVLTNAPRVPARRIAGEEIPLPQIKERFDEDLDEEQRSALAFDLAAPSGLPASSMTAGQRERLVELLRVYIERLPEDLALIERAKIEAAGIDGVHFAWAGSERPRDGHYYRVQGPNLIIEYDNTQDGANHLHAVWRNPTGDFGSDMLRGHIAAGHATN
jgi:hypothetical protein